MRAVVRFLRIVRRREGLPDSLEHLVRRFDVERQRYLQPFEGGGGELCGQVFNGPRQI